MGKKQALTIECTDDDEFSQILVDSCPERAALKRASRQSICDRRILVQSRLKRTNRVRARWSCRLFKNAHEARARAVSNTQQ